MAETYSTREMLARLVAFPTVSRDSNLDLIHFVRDYLAGHGVEARLVPDEGGTKANLYALIGPAVAGGVVLSGHTDVVPVDGQDWSSDPFRLTERDGLLYGRGTCDMKGFCAAALAAVPEMLAAGLRRPVQIALSYDEEVGCLGVSSMIAEMRETLPPAEAVIVGEPTEMRVVTAQKAGTGMRVTVKGHEVHSSRIPYGCSAVMVAARLITWLSERNLEVAREAVADARDAGVRDAGVCDAGRFLFDPPFTTFHAGVIEGGTAPNIAAGQCRFSVDIRALPGERERWVGAFMAHCAEVSAEIASKHPGAGVSVETRFTNPGLAPDPDARAEALARAVTGDNAPHGVSYGTEAGFFRDAGYSVVICGPGSIDQAHQADEFISASELEAGAHFMRGLTRRLAS